MKDTPETYEAVERWNQGKINIFDEMARLERERDEARGKCSDLGKAMSYSPESTTLLKKFLQAIKERDETNRSSKYACDYYLDEKVKAERERDEARHEIQGWKNKFNCAADMGARAENESEEQARLLGMSAEREESLRGKLFLVERELAKLKEAAKSVVEVWETPPWKIGETPSKAIAQLRDAIGYED